MHAQQEGGSSRDEAGPSCSSALEPQQHLQLVKLRSHFHKDVRKQLYTETDDRLFFDNLKVGGVPVRFFSLTEGGVTSKQVRFATLDLVVK